jgi:hypothetical protein
MAVLNDRTRDGGARATLERVTPERIRAAMFGTPVRGVQVVRQAWRVSDADSDELALLRVRGEWWVARRVSASLVIWAHPGEAEAEECFERLVADDAGTTRPWTEAATPLAG